ncbi:MAG: ATP/GTP-binding protein [Thiohalomonadales bacterium]
MANLKIIFTGPVGAGKTTAISTISDGNVILTDANASDVVKDKKSKTTVAMDYGTVRLEGGECIHLYGTPGQERFDFMWDILTKGGIGLVLLLDNTRNSPFQDMKFFLGQFKNFIERTQVIIGVTQMDRKAAPCIENYHKHLNKLGLNVPVFEVDARNKQDVSMLVKGLLYSLDPCIAE